MIYILEYLVVKNKQLKNYECHMKKLIKLLKEIKQHVELKNIETGK